MWGCKIYYDKSKSWKDQNEQHHKSGAANMETLAPPVSALCVRVNTNKLHTLTQRYSVRY